MERTYEYFYLLGSVLRNTNYRRKSFKTCLLSTVFSLIFALFLVRRMFMTSALYEKQTEMKREDAVDFERLLYYVKHPKTLCYTALSLGGSKDSKNRMDGDKVICQDLGAPLRPPCLVYSFGHGSRKGFIAGTTALEDESALMLAKIGWLYKPGVSQRHHCPPSHMLQPLLHYLRGNDEWSFEEDVMKFGCDVYTFDPSLKLGSHKHKPNIWFYPFGISDFNEDRFLLREMITWRMRTLDDMLEFLGHQNRTLDILKLDIEGDEWKVLEDILKKGLFKKINHLCVEVHLHSGNWARKLHILRRLEDDGQLRFFSSRKNQVTRPRHVPGLHNRTEQLFYELAWFNDRNHK